MSGETVISTIEVAAYNIPSPIDSTLAPISSEVRFAHPKKAPLPMLFKPSSTTTFFICALLSSQGVFTVSPESIIVKYDSTYDIAYNNLGVIYLDDLGRIKKAIELFEAARKHNPNYALAHYNLARSIAITGDKIEAAKLYQIAMDINTYTQELDPADIEEKIQDLFI